MSNRIYLDFKVNGMDLSRANFPCIADGSDKFIYARFSFSEEWAGATKYAIVARNNKTYVLTVADDNTVEIEREAVRTSGRFEIAMTGKIGSVVLTTIPAVVNVESTDFRDNPYGAETRLSKDVIFATLAAMDAKVATVEGYKNTVAALAETVNEQHAQVAVDKAAVAADKTSAASSAAAALASSAAAGLSETNAKNSEDAAAGSAAAALASAEAAAASAASVAGIVGQVETNTANISANTVAIGTLKGHIANREKGVCSCLNIYK